MTNDFKQEIISELALQLLPAVYGKAIITLQAIDSLVMNIGEMT